MQSEFFFFMQFLVTGLSMGSIYALVALGFVLIYKSTSILNLAQGEFMMVGAYICLSMTLDFGLNFFASFIITMFFSIILGLAVERLVLRPLIGEPIISIIMVTLGLTYILRGLVIMLWGNDIRQFNIFPQQPIDFWGVKVTYLYLWSMGISLVLLTFFAVFFKYSRTGIFMRAVADHQTAAQSMGISVKRVFALSWCIAAVVSSIGGILIGNIGGVGVELSHIGLRVLPAVIFGGLDSILGAIIGGLVVGVLEFLSAGYLDPIIPAINEVFPFIVLVLVLMIKPYGLFGIEEIERV
ncbi:MAG: branched-chain amino acid ABC transporter permease [Desulfobacterales bacterium]